MILIDDYFLRFNHEKNNIMKNYYSENNNTIIMEEKSNTKILNDNSKDNLTFYL